MKSVRKRSQMRPHLYLPSGTPTFSLASPRYHHKAFGLKGSAEVSTIIQIIWTVSERRTNGLAKDYGPGVHIRKLSQTCA